MSSCFCVRADQARAMIARVLCRNNVDRGIKTHNKTVLDHETDETGEGSNQEHQLAEPRGSAGGVQNSISNFS
jgi:hypothetical protein